MLGFVEVLLLFPDLRSGAKAWLAITRARELGNRCPVCKVLWFPLLLFFFTFNLRQVRKQPGCSGPACCSTHNSQWSKRNSGLDAGLAGCRQQRGWLSDRILHPVLSQLLLTHRAFSAQHTLLVCRALQKRLMNLDWF